MPSKKKSPPTSARDDGTEGRKRRLARLVSEFLEVPLRPADLQANPVKIAELKGLLEEALFQGNISELDPNWQFGADLDDPELFYGDKPLPPEIQEALTEEGVKTLVYFHNLLKTGFWDILKAELFSLQDQLRERNNGSAGSADGPLAEFASFQIPSFYYEKHGKITLAMSEDLEIPYTIEEGAIHFYHGAVNAIYALQNLISGLPIDIFKKCRGCERVFIETSRHKRNFCSRLCAARHSQREARRTDPEGYKNYHKAYYREKKAQKPLSAKIPSESP